MAQMQMEMEEEAWENWIKNNLVSAIEQKFNIDYSYLNDEALWKLYKKLKEKSNTDAEVYAGGTVYINIERLLKHFEAIPKVA